MDTGCLHTWAIINNDAYEFGVHASFPISFIFLNMYPGVELLGHIVVLLLVF